LIYRPEIDGLRAVAVLSVIVSHAGLGWMPGGFAGVDAFFVISGFLITSIILRDLDLGRFTFKDFYARRALRILPALFCMSTTVSILAWLTLTPSQIQDLSGSVFFSILSLSNLYFIDFVDYFAPSSEYIMLLHTWSLGV
jgi:peptidoglycan/LPS O-acetylase OafA/YrhL